MDGLDTIHCTRRKRICQATYCEKVRTMNASTTPTLRKIADRSYVVESNVDAAIEFLSLLFGRPTRGEVTALWSHRWRHVGPNGVTMVVLFKPHPPDTSPRLSLLGPQLEIVDMLAVEVAA